MLKSPVFDMGIHHKTKFFTFSQIFTENALACKIYKGEKTHNWQDMTFHFVKIAQKMRLKKLDI